MIRSSIDLLRYWLSSEGNQFSVRRTLVCRSSSGPAVNLRGPDRHARQTKVRRTKQWDTCAPQIILTEAGGRLTDLFGMALNYNVREIQNRNGLVASNGAAHDRVIDRLAPLLAEFGRKPV